MNLQGLLEELRRLEAAHVADYFNVAIQKELDIVREKLADLHLEMISKMFGVSLDRHGHHASFDRDGYTIQVYLPDLSTIAVIYRRKWRKYESLETLADLVKSSIPMAAIFDMGEAI